MPPKALRLSQEVSTDSDNEGPEEHSGGNTGGEDDERDTESHLDGDPTNNHESTSTQGIDDDGHVEAKPSVIPVLRPWHRGSAEETTEPHEITRHDVEAYMEKWWLDFQEPDVEDHSAEDHGMDEVLRNVGLMWEQEQKSHISAGQLEELCSAYEDIVSRFEEFIIILYDKLRRFKHDLDDLHSGDTTTSRSATSISTESDPSSFVRTKEIFEDILDDPYYMFSNFCYSRHAHVALLERLWSLQQAESPFGHTGKIKGFSSLELRRCQQQYEKLILQMGQLLDSPHFWESLEKKWDPRLATESSVAKVNQWQEQVDHDLCYRSASSEGSAVAGDMPVPDGDDRRSEDSFIRPESPTHRSEQADMEDILDLKDILLPHGFGGIF
jgi:hypothetical protein